MNIINLRSVGNYEIPDSFRGILRISPNGSEDDPTNLLTDTSKEICLSDSVGNQLPLTFIPKSFSTILVNREGLVDLINLSIKVNKLFVSNELNIKETLYIESADDVTPPIIFSHNFDAVGYPIEAPDDKSYFNFGNKYNFLKTKTWQQNVNSIPESSELYTNKNKDQWIEINGASVLKRCDYVLGASAKDKYKKSKSEHLIHNLSELNDESGTYTQLSFLPIESLLVSALKRNANSIVSTLKIETDETLESNTRKNLVKTTFSPKAKDSDISDHSSDNKTPIINLGVQAGTIHYSAIPAHRYFFHLARYYDTNIIKNYIDDTSATLKRAKASISTPIKDIASQYVLCDGKNINSDYPAINKHLFNINWSNVHEAIKNSIGDKTKTDKTFKTPSLFEYEQISPRFLKVLESPRTTEKTTIDNSTNNNLQDNFSSEQTISFIPLMKI